MHRDQARLEQVHGENSDFLGIHIVRADLAMLAVEDEAVRAVPTLDDIQPFLNFSSDNRDLSRERESSEQFGWLNRRYGETETQLGRSAITPSIRADSSQNEMI